MLQHNTHHPCPTEYHPSRKIYAQIRRNHPVDDFLDLVFAYHRSSTPISPPQSLHHIGRRQRC